MITNLSIDRSRGEARTPFNEDVVELEEVDDDLTSILAADRTAANYQKTGDLSNFTLYWNKFYLTATLRFKNRKFKSFFNF